MKARYQDRVKVLMLIRPACCNAFKTDLLKFCAEV